MAFGAMAAVNGLGDFFSSIIVGEAGSEKPPLPGAGRDRDCSCISFRPCVLDATIHSLDMGSLGRGYEAPRASPRSA